MDVTVRTATASDVPSLEIVRRQAIEHAYVAAYDRAAVAELVAEAADALPDQIAADDHVVLIAESEVSVLGYGIFDREAGVLRGLYTAPKYQGEGWGTRLLHKLEEHAREAGLDTISADVPKTATGFFEAHDFAAAGTAKREGLEATRMEKHL